MVLKLGHFGKRIRNAWKALKCGAGEEWRNLLDQSCKKIKKIITQSKGQEYDTYNSLREG